MALTIDWSGVTLGGNRGAAASWGCARELQVTGLGGQGPFVTVTVLWCVREDSPSLCS